jgi:phytoene synthase
VAEVHFATSGNDMSRDTNFYYSFLVLPPHKRRAIVAVWDFCRAVDDAVDEVVPESDWAGSLSDEARARAAERLAGWRAELAAMYEGTPGTPQGLALQPYIREFELPRARFEELVDGVEMDLRDARYDSFASLLAYCRRVASSVGLICLEIFGYRTERARAYAENLGVALQLTNIVRDVRTDIMRGRVYLPREDLERFGVSEDDLRSGRLTSPVVDLLRFECERARYYYRRAADELPPEDARSLLAAEIMSGIYFELLRRIERKGYDVFSARIRVPRPLRAMIALRLWIKALLGIRSAEFRIQTRQ